MIPRLIEDLAGLRIVDISTGDSHCLALTYDCEVRILITNRLILTLLELSFLGTRSAKLYKIGALMAC